MTLCASVDVSALSEVSTGMDDELPSELVVVFSLLILLVASVSVSDEFALSLLEHADRQSIKTIKSNAVIFFI